MRYAYITPRASNHNIARELVDVIEARDDRAAARLESASKVAAARRASQHTLKVVTRELTTPDLAWERLVYNVQGFRR